MSLKIEKHWPTIGAAVVAAASWHFSVRLGTRADTILSTATSVGSILVGFLSMALPLFLSLDTKPIRKVRESGHYAVISSYMRQTIWLTLLMTGFSLALLFVPDPDRLRYVVPWIAIVAWSTLSFVRTTRVFFIAIERDGEFK